MKYAVGADHLIYGWVFFGVGWVFFGVGWVFFGVVMIGSLWLEDVVSTQPAAPAAGIVAGPGPALGSVAAAALAAAWPAGAYWLESGPEERPPVLQAPQAARVWTAVARQLPAFKPNFPGARATVEQAYAKDAARAAIYLRSYYRCQRPGFQLISGNSTLVSSAGVPRKNTHEAHSAIALSGEQSPVVERRLSGASGNLFVWQRYWLDGSRIVNSDWGKLRHVLGRSEDGALVVLYVPYEGQPDAARAQLREFAAAMLFHFDEPRTCTPVQVC